MKVAFIWDWQPEYSQAITWQDGLAAALRELIRRGHEVTVHTDTAIAMPHPYFPILPIPTDWTDRPDVILHWGDMTRPHARLLADLNIPMAICFAGGEPAGENYPFFKHVFVESQVYLRRFEELDVPTSIAFGTNTELFKPMPEQPKLFDTIFPATFAAWKRHYLYAQATKGLRALACGYIYTTHEQECWQEPQRRGVMVLPHVSAEVLHYLYAASRVCVITSSSVGGSQRSVLEAMAMNLPLVVTDSNKFDYLKDAVSATPEPEAVREAIELALANPVETRQHVLDNWSEISYADALERGLESIQGIR